MTKREPILGVMGSGNKDDHFPRVKPLESLIAEIGFHLLTGDGFSIMKVANEGFTSYLKVKKA